eukprot:3918061-Rhodomonas_salina.1
MGEEEGLGLLELNLEKRRVFFAGHVVDASCRRATLAALLLSLVSSKTPQKETVAKVTVSLVVPDVLLLVIVMVPSKPYPPSVLKLWKRQPQNSVNMFVIIIVIIASASAASKSAAAAPNQQQQGGWHHP